MTLTVELTPEEEARLAAAARSQGIGVEECVRKLLAKHLPPAKPGQATLDLLARWLDEDATDDPEEIRKAEEEWEEFKRNINETRAAAGARIVFP
ncbi:MAG: hypothetical protein HY321_11560 [Armatimonadetes bacterium]|nr:hypothetical protein [Armatimonadota bacterium]